MTSNNGLPITGNIWGPGLGNITKDYFQSKFMKTNEEEFFFFSIKFCCYIIAYACSLCVTSEHQVFKRTSEVDRLQGLH